MGTGFHDCPGFRSDPGLHFFSSSDFRFCFFLCHNYRFQFSLSSGLCRHLGIGFCCSAGMGIFLRLTFCSDTCFRRLRGSNIRLHSGFDHDLGCILGLGFRICRYSGFCFCFSAGMGFFHYLGIRF